MPLCVIDECKNPARTRRKPGPCEMHYYRQRRHGDPAAVLPMHQLERPPTGQANWKWQGDDVSYRAAHDRIEAARGKATEHICVDCSTPAQQWSYNYSAIDERSEVVKGRRIRYSPDPAMYDARCRSCHVRFDVAAAKRR